MKKTPWSAYLFLTMGAIAILYYFGLSLRYGLNYIVFSWTFLLIGSCLMVIGLLERKLQRLLISYLPKAVRLLFITLAAIGIGCFLFVEAQIIAYGSKASSTQANTLIVLGAQLNGSDISRLLRYRLDAALEFHEQYPDVLIIVSGGQGAGETVSEASAMKAYLVEHGIKEQQILCEDQSKNTYENFAFSKQLLKDDTQVSVISNDFHMYRAAYLCEESGLTCSLYPARSDLDLAPNFYFREFFGVVKDQYLAKLK